MSRASVPPAAAGCSLPLQDVVEVVLRSRDRIRASVTRAAHGKRRLARFCNSQATTDTLAARSGRDVFAIQILVSTKNVLQRLVGRVQWCTRAALFSDLSCSCTCDCACCRRFRRATIANSAELPDRSIGLLPQGCWCSLLECRSQGPARMQGRTVRSRVGCPGWRNPQGPGLPVGASLPRDQPAEHQPASLQRSCEWHANDAGVSSAM